MLGDLSDTNNLSATLRSNPALPQPDVVSLITTGSLANTGTGIPNEILDRKKTGFQIPLHDWLQGGRPPVGRESALRTWARQVHSAYMLVKPVAATPAELDRAYAEERHVVGV